MDYAFDVIYEDNHLIAVNKKPGVLVQGDITEDEPLNEMVKSYVKKKYKKPGAVYLGTVHRIDRPVSGLVLFARTSKAADRMTKLFTNRKVSKTYWALVENKPPEDEDTLIHWLKKDPNKNRTHVYESDRRGGQEAELSYKFKGRVGENYLLEIYPKTGRPHQIRAQLAKIGCPIKGDVKYGSKTKTSGGIFLHSRELAFEHPVKKEPVRFTARVPNNDIWNNFTSLA